VNVRNFSLVLALVAFSANSVFAQGDFFWSFADLGGGATNSFADNTYNVGDMGSAYLYYSTTGPSMSELDTGAFLDLATTMAGVINITNAETFDYDILVGGTVDVGDRWGDSFGPGDVAADGQSASINAFRVVNGDGIINLNTGPTFLDGGYDAAAGAFLFGRVDFTAVADGSTGISLAAGSGGIVNDGQTLNPVFGGINITVGAIPEPTTAGLLAFGLIGLVARRRR